MENRYWRPYSRRRSEEFQEEDVWNVIKDNRQVGIRIDESNSNAPTSPLSISRRLPSAARMIPGPHKTAEHSDSTDALKLLQHSAPVSIPDWPKIYRQSPKRKDDVIDDHIHGGVDESDDDDEEEEEDDDDGESLPPHEWLARKNARSKVSSFSVCEGAGRTLKGRDLCRVRNAILSKTGFI